MPARERWSRENPGTRLGLCCTKVAGGGGGGWKVMDFPSPWVTYDLPSRFTHLQELARNTINADQLIWSICTEKITCVNCKRKRKIIFLFRQPDSLKTMIRTIKQYLFLHLHSTDKLIITIYARIHVFKHCCNTIKTDRYTWFYRNQVNYRLSHDWNWMSLY